MDRFDVDLQSPLPSPTDSEEVVFISRGDVSDFNPENILPKSEAEQAAIHAWLHPTQYAGEGSEYETHLASHLEGTGDWVFGSDIYQQWHDSPEHGILWVRGIPGAGKSVLASTIIAKLRQEETPVLYFFFRYSFDTNNTSEALLRDCLTQALRYSPPLQHELSARMSRGSLPARDLSLVELWRYLHQALRHLPKVYLVIDAMDELLSEDLEPLLKSLDELGRWRPAEIKLVVTSRPVVTVERTFSNRVKTLDVRLDQNSVEKDITLYVQYRLRDFGGDLAAESEELVLKRSRGLFLYAKLALESLLSSKEQYPHFNLPTLPADLPAMYSKILREQSERIKTDGKDSQQFILQLVTSATRPLRLLEIADLMRVTRGGDDLGAVKDSVRSLCGPLLEILPDETTRIVHHSLTEYLTQQVSAADEESRVFPRFCHACTNLGIAISCISYLSKGCLGDVVYKSRSRTRGDINYTNPAALDTKIILPPFTRYAGLNWALHLRRGRSGCRKHHFELFSIHQMLDALLKGPNLDKIDVLANTQMEFQPAPLHLAIALDLNEYADHLLTKHRSAYMKDGTLDDSLILFAASEGNEYMVNQLVDHNANLTVYNERGRTPLHLAVAHDHAVVAKALLNAGMDPDIRRGSDCYFGMPGESETPWTPLEKAFASGSDEIITAFCRSLQSTKLVTEALYIAAQNSQIDAIQHLLRHPQLDINAYHGEHTPLSAASRKRNLSAMELLLKAGALIKPSLKVPKTSEEIDERYRFRSVPAFEDPELDDANFLFDTHLATSTSATTAATISEEPQCFHTVLHDWVNHPTHRYGPKPPQASDEDIERGIRLLVDHGADVHQINEEGDAPIHLASDGATARALLNCGADVDAINPAGESLLHITYASDVLDVILPEADLNLRSRDTHRTPLLSALIEGYNDAADRVHKALRLIQNGANIFAVDKYKNSALHLAISMDHEDGTIIPLVEKLCSLGADVNAKNYQGKTPLHMGVSGSGRVNSIGSDTGRFDSKVLLILQQAGADLNIKDHCGRTPLFQYIEAAKLWKTDANIVSALVQAGATIHTRDLAGRSLLHAETGNFCNSREDSGIFRTLHEVSPTVVDYDGNTLFHEAAPRLANERFYDANGPPLFQTLTSLGVDPRKPNRLGQTPFRILTTMHPMAFHLYCNVFTGGRFRDADEWSGFDLFLERFPDLADLPDNLGVRPLHYACTFSEYMTRKLLEKGVEFTSGTKEGLTPFHLAARSRQANIIGTLLDAFRPASSPEEISRVLDLKDKENRTALYYAAASGTFETFKLLVEAGASVDQCSYVGSAWNGCADFEMEECNWPEQDTEYIQPLFDRKKKTTTADAGSVSLSDKARPKLTHDRNGGTPQFPIARLNEIIDLLVCMSSKIEVSIIDQAILSAAERGHDYTVECLVHARGKLSSGTSEVLGERVGESSRRRREKLMTGKASSTADEIKRLMVSRYYAEVVQELTSTNCLEATTDGPSLVSKLAAAGFTRLTSKAASEVVISITEGRDLQKTEKDPYGFAARTSPLLCACSATMPNLAVVQALVEESGVDVNVCAPKMDNSHQIPNFSGGLTALHILAQTGHWWQWKQAIPYLIAHGADVNAIESRYSGLTPLGSALENINGPHFSRETFKVLLELGADPNIGSWHGKPYLSRTTKHPEIFQLLLKHGAAINRSVLVSAIQQEDVGLVQMLLNNGADPNERQVGEERPRIHFSDDSFQMERTDPNTSEEMYILELLTQNGKPSEAKTSIFQMLLAHGANPLAPYARTTILHRVMENRTLLGHCSGQNVYLRLLLDQPGLDFETRDFQGCNLFLLAAKHPCDDEPFLKTAQKLLEGGADISARDLEGKNAMHFAFSSVTRRNFIHSKAPKLLTSPDNEGKTVLHYALTNRKSSRRHGDLSWRDTIQGIIAEGASVTHADNNGQTPLHLLLKGSEWMIDLSDNIKCASRELFEQFISLGADINARNKEGETPIFAYVRSSTIRVDIDASILGPYPENVSSNNDAQQDWQYEKGKLESFEGVRKEYLIWELFEQRGSDLHACNSAGESLLHIIARERNPTGWGNIIDRGAVQFKLLMGKGLDATKEDSMHRTPLDVAAALGRDDILGLFKTDT